MTASITSAATVPQSYVIAKTSTCYCSNEREMCNPNFCFGVEAHVFNALCLSISENIAINHILPKKFLGLLCVVDSMGLTNRFDSWPPGYRFR